MSKPITDVLQQQKDWSDLRLWLSCPTVPYSKSTSALF